MVIFITEKDGGYQASWRSVETGIIYKHWFQSKDEIRRQFAEIKYLRIIEREYY